MIRHRDIPYIVRDGRELLLDVCMPDEPAPSPRPAILFMHGGGWIDGDKTTSANDWLAEAGFFTASIDYRLTDVARFPAQIHDAKAAIRWVRAHAAEYNVDPQRIGVWGFSAGAHLAALCAVTNDTPGYEGEGNPGFSSAVQATVAISPPTDFLIDWYAVAAMPVHADGEMCMTGLLGGTATAMPELARQASPLWQVDSTAAPQLIFHGTLDGLVPVGQSRAYVATLGHCGAAVEYVEFADEAHWVDWGIYVENPDPHDLRGRITAFFTAQLMAG